jgi:hypothetical protein
MFNMLIHAAEDPSGKEMDVDYENVVLCRIAESILCIMLHNLGDVVKPGKLNPMKKVYGINWRANDTSV